MMNAVKKRAELYDDWASLVMETLEAKLEKKKGKYQTQKKKKKNLRNFLIREIYQSCIYFSGLPVFRSLLAESESKTFPDNDLLRRLRMVTQDAEKCSSVAQQLLNGKRQTR